MNDTTFSQLNITENPFSMATSRSGFYQTQATRVILDEFEHGVMTRKGFMVLIGEVGVGKTSLSLQLFSILEQRHTVFAWIFNTMFTKEELFRAISSDFGLPCERHFTLLDYQKILHDFFLKTHAAGQTAVIAVDEAHNLSDDSLEALRMLGNFEFEGQKLVQVILFAQPELDHRLRQHDMRQLKSRIAIYEILPQFTRSELIGYVNFKLSQAGSQIHLTGLAAWMLWRATRGNVRLAKLIMERALYGCLAHNRQAISPRIMHLAVRELNGISEMSGIIHPARSPLPHIAGLVMLTLLGLSVFSFTGRPMEQIIPAGMFRQSVIRDVEAAPRGEENIHRKDVASALVELEGFLGKPQTESLAPWVKMAIAEKKITALRQNLPPGLAVALLDTLPDTNESSPSWRALPWQKLSQTPPEWLIIWHSEYPVETPVPGESGRLVEEAQSRLKALGFLSKPANGQLNSATWYACSQFQRSVGLPPTGALDPGTVFWLRHFRQSSTPKS
jgi:type II secretory pathway predicted ATPase ExeA